MVFPRLERSILRPYRLPSTSGGRWPCCSCSCGRDQWPTGCRPSMSSRLTNEPSSRWNGGHRHGRCPVFRRPGHRRRGKGMDAGRRGFRRSGHYGQGRRPAKLVVLDRARSPGRDDPGDEVAGLASLDGLRAIRVGPAAITRSRMRLCSRPAAASAMTGADAARTVVSSGSPAGRLSARQRSVS
jgi:hypothetical protein